MKWAVKEIGGKGVEENGDLDRTQEREKKKAKKKEGRKRMRERRYRLVQIERRCQNGHLRMEKKRGGEGKKGYKRKEVLAKRERGV